MSIMHCHSNPLRKTFMSHFSYSPKLEKNHSVKNKFVTLDTNFVPIPSYLWLWVYDIAMLVMNCHCLLMHKRNFVTFTIISQLILLKKKSGSASNYVCFYLFDTSFHLCLAPYLFGVTSYRGQILLDNSVLCFILRWLKEKRKLNIFVEPRVKLELLNESSYYNFVQTWQDGKVLHLDFCIVEY